MRSVGNTLCSLSLCSGLFAGLLSVNAIAAVITVPAQQPTIQAAINAASNGDTILVANGTHSGRGNHSIDFLGKAVTLQSMGGPENCIIDAQATQQMQRMVFYFHTNETSASVVQGFTIKGGAVDGPGVPDLQQQPDDPRLRHHPEPCRLLGRGDLLRFRRRPSSPTARSSTTSPRMTAAQDVANTPGSPVFTNCLIANNEGSFTGGAILAYHTGSTPKLVNCTVTGNHAIWGKAIYSNNLQIENSIIHGNLGDTLQIRDVSGGDVTAKYSNVQGGFIGVGNVDVTPQFVNPAGGDFHLLRTSACVDAGDPATVTTEGSLDLDGDPRRFSMRIDMGIDEFRKAGDVTGDHFTNIDDLVQVITNWGPCQVVRPTSMATSWSISTTWCW